ncbi:putative membrane protein YsxD [Pichia kudriavzevii]|nr:putative membrane protein YsxD [Pichia kudriavzevii]
MIPGLMIHIIKVNWFPDDVDMVRSMIGFSILPNKSEEEKHRQIEVAKRICGYDDNDEDTDSRSSEKV